jgi:hypothetical protein
MKKKNENLNELLAAFYDGETAWQIADDINAGDRIFGSNPAPEPSAELLADIKQNMFAAAQKNRRQNTRFIWQYAAAAAVVIIVFGAGIALLHRPAQRMQTYASESFWQDALASTENSIESQLADIEYAETDTLLLTLESKGSPEMTAITDISTELDDIDATFWEG